MTRKKKGTAPGTNHKGPGRVRSRTTSTSGSSTSQVRKAKTKKSGPAESTATSKKAAPKRRAKAGKTTGANVPARNSSAPVRGPGGGPHKKTNSAKTVAESPTLSSVPKRKKKQETEPAGLIVTQDSDSDPDETFIAEDPYPLTGVDVTMLGIGSPIFPPTADLDDDDGLDSSDDLGGPLLADDPSVETRIREIEERLDGLMAADPSEELDSIAPGSGPDDEPRPTDAESAVDSAREVLESEYYRRRWGRGSLDHRSFDIDDFGMDPSYEEKLRPAVEFLFKRYFRVEVEGIRNVPNKGRAVIVSNHSGALPLDGVMLREAVRTRHPVRSDFRWLAEDFSFYLPFLGVAMNRIGAVRACPENAERLLEQERLVGVFPEGAEGIKKLFRNRYRLQRFGRGGFVRLCLKTGSPIVPCAVVGAEETNPILYRFDNLSKLLGLDYLPVTPTFPALGPLGLLPAPTKWRIIFGEPISVDEYGPQAAQDHVLVGRLAERVRSSISQLLETALRRRKSIWF